MKFVRAEWSDLDSTCLKAYLLGAKYGDLSSVLGKPDDDGGEPKVPVSWVVKMEDGFVLTIYAWKMSKREAMLVNDEWNIGGKDEATEDEVVAHVQRLFPAFKVRGSVNFRRHVSEI
jgi:acyl-CoA synthetase (AMP-forming)/AMP-acid ligase II